MATIIGTSNFVSEHDARKYYEPYGYDEEDVAHKIEAGEITIGKPVVNDGDALDTDHGRYVIREGEGENIVNIESTVLDVLSNATMDGNTLKLNGQLSRPLYVATNKVLEAAGGKWNRKAQAHIFESDAAEIMDAIILTGKVTNKKQELGYFPTPTAVVKRLLELADIRSGMRVLEPSAGRGAIVQGILDEGGGRVVLCYEIDPQNVAYMEQHGFEIGSNFTVQQADFLSIIPTPIFERVVMNPPFAKQADIRHVMHAMAFLAPQGRLVSVMASGVTFRTNALTENFRELMKAHNGTIEALPESTFAESGTNVNTVIVTMEA